MEDTGYTLDGTVDFGGRPVLASRTGKWKACYFILVYQTLERFAYFGVAANLVNYMTTQLNKDLISSISNVNNWSGSAWITPILGAYIADSFLGRFWTITLSLIIYAIGFVLLAVTTSLKSLRPTCTNGICSNASNLQLTLFYLSIYTIAIASGAVKPNMSTFGADQFDDFNPQEISPKISFFNWWMFTTAFGILVATLLVVYIQERIGWGLGHKARKATSITRDFIRVMVVAFRNRKLHLPSSPSELHEIELPYYINIGKRQIHHTSHFKFLDKAAINESEIDVLNPPCTVTQVEGIKLLLRMFQIWLLMLIPSNILALEVTIFIKQGTTMERNLGSIFHIPAASLWSFLVFTILISLPIYDHYFIPFMRQKTGNRRGITLLQRVGIGIAIEVIAMAITYAVEIKRMHVIQKQQIVGPEEIVPMSIFWLLPQNVVLGISDTFLLTGLHEFFYDQSPEEMKCLGTTFYTSTIASGSFFSTFLVYMIDKVTRNIAGKSWIGNNLNDCHLDYYYGFLFVISTLNFGVFLWVSSGYIYKEENSKEVNDMGNEGIV
ncbi:hypothetical protein TanjilG_31938 [Lupinus angustifolius]|uniref:Uncharacterized protein n=1 Tax=Lupinus angustifolius TaxID=3871 RepID=A0A394D908_LUPAN|nr:hypothetical protein TanjilG_31938 [Lupinus angustifolius]